MGNKSIMYKSVPGSQALSTRMSDVNLFSPLKYYSFWIDLNNLDILLNVFIDK